MLFERDFASVITVGKSRTLVSMIVAGIIHVDTKYITYLRGFDLNRVSRRFI